MSDPTRQQRRFVSRVPVRISRNYKLPPISITTSSADFEHGSARSSEPATSSKLTPIVAPAQNENSAVAADHKTGQDSSSVDIDQFWLRLRQHLANEPRPNPNDRGCQQTVNKVVRVFVSSTFTDFFNEREVLIKRVFPELREEMEPVGLQIIDCDLRWGVPKDSTTEQTILTCLEELDRCFEDNAQPFFIGLISDKYGWVPKMSELPSKITERYRWVDGASITSMEFIHGAFRTRNPNAFFLIRNSQNLLKNLPEKYNDKFRDKDEMSRLQIQALKRHLPEIVPSDHIFHYDCFYNGLDSTSGRERVRIDGLGEFEEKAKQFLSEAIRKWYADSFDQKVNLDPEREKMMTFLVTKTQFYIDRPKEFTELVEYVNGRNENKELHSSFEGSEEHVPLMTVLAPAGNGKTMLLGKFVLYLEEQMRGKFLLLYHFLDGAFHPNVNVFMMSRLSQLLKRYVEENNIISPTTGERLDTTQENFVSQALPLIKIPLVIILDGLDKGDVHRKRNYREDFPFWQYAILSSDHTYIVLSCETDSRLHEELRRYHRYELRLGPFTTEQRAAYTEMFFRRFNKTLEAEQRTLILNNKGAEHPLYLACLCENLRQFGDYSLITKRLKAYPETIDELLDVLFEEVCVTISNQVLVDAFFKLLIASNVGILELDIVPLLDRYLNANANEENRVQIDRLSLATVRRHLKIFIDTTWIDGFQIVTFRHTTLLQKLEKRYFEGKEAEMTVMHGFLARYYRQGGAVKEYSILRVPYHYDKAHMINDLVTFLRSMESRPINRGERQAYLRKHRCTKMLTSADGVNSQRAYACYLCATLFKLGPYTMTKSACVTCTEPLLNVTITSTNVGKFEARTCVGHGNPSYPRSVRCVVCKALRPNQAGTLPTALQPVPLFICTQCAHRGGVGLRCCEFQTN